MWILKSYGPGSTRGSHACVLSIRYFMPRSHEALRQSTGPVREHMGSHTHTLREHCAGTVYPAAEV